ncbi:hypothetical protein CT0861_12918 [Colletotrichum tofieldiae]|uniref:Uncharacterized protein n=1 Tax=Colletotrichum tofieldiae TaxID=708197 RepID=A0A166U377_9PEZI|nr:hypothetical protein CT0861_12918 [Colletotrichum tofieldiae]
MTAPITVFEDPWPKDKPTILLEVAAARHVEVVEIFLKLLPYFRYDEKGRIHDESLAHSEWRYMCYIRFLDLAGVSPNDFPPPWDVAMIWYCHLLSPTRFHRHLWDNKHQSYGLNHNQFPLTRLLHLAKSGKWSDKKAQKKWEYFNRRKIGPQLPFQLWRSPPWEVKRKLNILSSLSFRKPNNQTEEEPTIVMYNIAGKLCTTFRKEEWALADWTEIRTGRQLETCLKATTHSRLGQRCELAMWPNLRDLRDTLDRQIGFWKALVQARDTQKNFNTTVTESIGDYERFIKLLGRPAQGTFTSRPLEYDMDTIYREKPGTTASRNREFVPPNMVIDLLWHTHRLYPANYWIWSFTVARRLIDYEPTASAITARRTLTETRLEWKKRYNEDCSEQFAMDEDGVEEYIPDAAVVPPGHPARVKAKFILGGVNPVRERRSYTKGTYYVFEGAYVSFEGSCASGGGDGGGCDGDGGGGGGDGGGS